MSIIRNLGLTGIALSATITAQAAALNYDINAHIVEIYDPYNVLQGSLNIGDPINGSYQLDDSVPDQDPAPEYAHYDLTHSQAAGFNLNVGPFTTQSDRNNTAFMLDSYVADNIPFDHYHVASWGNTPFQNGAQISDILLYLFDDQGTAFTGANFSSTPGDINAYEQRELMIFGQNGDFHIKAFVDSIGSDGSTPPPPVPANVVRLQVKAVVQNIYDNSGALGTTLKPGDTFTAFYTYDLNAQDQDPNPDSSYYPHYAGQHQFGFEIDLGNNQLIDTRNQGEFNMYLTNGEPNTEYFMPDTYLADQQTYTPLPGGGTIFNIGLYLHDENGNMHNSADLSSTPPTVPTYSGWADLSFWGMSADGNNDFSFHATVVSITEYSVDLMEISPANSSFDPMQRFDAGIILAADLPPVVDLQIHLNGQPIPADCNPGFASRKNRQTLVCPNFSSMLNAEKNTAIFRVLLEDGRMLEQSAEWQILLP